MIKQALKAEPLMRVVSIRNTKSDEMEATKKWIAARAGVDLKRIHVLPGSAKTFLEDSNIGQVVAALVQTESAGAPF